MQWKRPPARPPPTMLAARLRALAGAPATAPSGGYWPSTAHPRARPRRRGRCARAAGQGRRLPPLAVAQVAAAAPTPAPSGTWQQGRLATRPPRQLPLRSARLGWHQRSSWGEGLEALTCRSGSGPSRFPPGARLVARCRPAPAGGWSGAEKRKEMSASCVKAAGPSRRASQEQWTQWQRPRDAGGQLRGLARSLRKETRTSRGRAAGPPERATQGRRRPRQRPPEGGDRPSGSTHRVMRRCLALFLPCGPTARAAEERAVAATCPTGSRCLALWRPTARLLHPWMRRRLQSCTQRQQQRWPRRSMQKVVRTAAASSSTCSGGARPRGLRRRRRRGPSRGAAAPRTLHGERIAAASRPCHERCRLPRVAAAASC
mmetsp:Transcript_30831/g.85043  ORF Transcript_30831/g.85043 Transcript_30831/m.85043 type:complete len:374 (+) Transcript_30831:143-1264(+)